MATKKPSRKKSAPKQGVATESKSESSQLPSTERNVAQLLGELEIEIGNTAGNMNRTSDISNRLENLNVESANDGEKQQPYAQGLVLQLIALKNKLAAINASTSSHLNQIERHI